jgi:hypothetical protein
VAEKECSFLIELKESCFWNGATGDDVDGEVRVVGLVRRIIPEGSSYSLTRYVLPDLNRHSRRMLKEQYVAELMKKVPRDGAQEGPEPETEIDGPLIVGDVLTIC